MKTAMILAAGRGERLRPITDHQPKALCELSGQSLIGHHLAKLAQAGYEKIVINHAHLGGKIRQFIQQSDHFGLQIELSPEPPGGLETGGGIVNALDRLGTEPFITLNADIYTDYDLSQLRLQQHSLAHVILVPKPAYRATGDYGLSSEGLLTNTPREYIFSGITAYHPDFFQASHPGRYSVTPMMRRFVDEQRVTAELYHGLWFDIGTAQQWTAAAQALANKR